MVSGGWVVRDGAPLPLVMQDDAGEDGVGVVDCTVPYKHEGSMR